MCSIPLPTVSERTLQLLYFLVISALLSFLNQGCMDVCGLSLTCPLVSVNQRNVCLLCIASLFPNAFSRDEKATWPFFFKTANPVITRPFARPPCGLPSCFMSSDTHWDQTRSPDPLLGLPLKVLMALFVCGASSPSSLVPASSLVPNPSLLYSDCFATCVLLMTLAAQEVEDSWTFTVGQCVWWENGADLGSVGNREDKHLLDCHWHTCRHVSERLTWCRF